MAQWRKVVVSGSTAELNHISASGDIVPVSDAGSSLGSAGLEWDNLYIDGTANIDSLVADTADIDGGTVDNATIGANTHTSIKGTTIDATTDFTIGGTVITDNTITDDGTLVIASTTATSFSDGNITNVGDINVDTVSVDDAAVGLDIQFGGNTTLNKITLTDNLADALNINEGGNSYIKFITSNSSEQIVVGKNSTFNGTTIADLGTVTTATSITATDLIGTNVDGILGADTARAITGTTIDATTDFTIGTTVITDDSIVMTPTTDDTVTIAASTNGALTITTVDTNAAAANLLFTIDGTAEIATAGDITLDPGGNNVLPGGDSADSLGASGTAWAKLWVDDIDLAGQGSISMGGTAGRIDLDADDDTSIRSAADDVITFEAGAVDILEINATSISGSSISTGSFGHVKATTIAGDGAGITGLTSAAIDTVAAMTNNYVITATAGTAVTGEVNLQFDGTDLVVAGGGKVAFRDNGGEYIYSVSDNVLGLAAGSEIDLTATTVDINGLVDISGNLTVGGNLIVSGDTTTLSTTNLAVGDQFIFAATGSAGTNVDAGLIVQSGSFVDSGSALYHDIGSERWAVAKGISSVTTAVTPKQMVVTTAVSASSPHSSYGEYGVGEMWIETDTQDIWIRTE